MKRLVPIGLTLAFVLTACATSAGSELEASATARPSVTSTSSVSPSAPATTSPGATPAPTQQPTAPPSPDLVMQVAVTDLVMRSAPGVGGDSDILAPALAAPQLVFLFEGPVAADGYQWYRARTFSLDPTALGRTGWIAAASRDGEPWIVPAQLDCPAPTFTVLVSRSGEVGSSIADLACYGDRAITLDGSHEGCAAAEGISLEPSWLVPVCYLAVVAVAETSGPPETDFWMAVLPTVSPTGEGDGVRIVGHYDDPVAETCHYPTPSEEYPNPLDVAQAVLQCRATFVATGITYQGASA